MEWIAEGVHATLENVLKHFPTIDITRYVVKKYFPIIEENISLLLYILWFWFLFYKLPNINLQKIDNW